MFEKILNWIMIVALYGFAASLIVGLYLASKKPPVVTPAMMWSVIA